MLFAALAALSVACGVSFADPPQGNEFFDSLTVTGDMRVGKPLTAFVIIRQRTPAVVDMTCELRQEKELVKEIGRDAIAALPEGGPDATPFAASFAYDFTVDEPGSYRVECYTPADEDNFILNVFDVESAPQPSETPPPANPSGELRRHP